MKKILLFLAGISVFTMNGQVPSYVPINGLVAYYPFNGNAIDESSNSYDGTVNGATLTTDRFGNPNSAYSFNGINNEITTSLIQGSITSYSISCWINTSSNSIDACSGGGSIVQSRGPASQFDGKSFFIHFGDVGQANGQPKILVGINGEALIYGKKSLIDINDNNWHHIVGTWTGVSGSSLSLDQVKLYVDGILVSNASNVYYDPIGPTNAPVNSPYQTKFGVFEGCIPNKYFNGVIDDIGIWDRALTANEVAALYNGNQTPFCPMDTFSSIPNININSNDAVLFNNEIYCIDAISTTKKLSKYNPVTGVVSVVSNPTFTLGETGFVSLNDKLYCFGGWTGSATSNKAYVYDTVSQTWTSLICL